MTGFSDYVNMMGDRMSNNLSTSFSSLSATQWIRLIIVAGAYMLLRPYLIKIGGRIQMRQHEADEQAAEEEAAAIAAGKQAALSPNALRESGKRVAQKVEIPADSDSEFDEDGPKNAATSAVDWGKNARRRQRKIMRKMLEQHEKKLAQEQEDEEDKEIQEFLVD